MAKSIEMLDARTENNKGSGDRAIMSASLARGATNQTCKEKGSDRSSTACDGHADVSICERSASSLEGKCKQRTPLYGSLDEAVKGLCLQVGWLPFQ